MSPSTIPGCRAAVALLGVWLASGQWAFGGQAQGARITLLPAGPRASLVVELDDALTGATTIEAADDRTVAVEIGPVKGKILNQLLQAPETSPLVSQVRVRGVTHGTDGTIVIIHVIAKAPVMGSVRRAARRVYIDLAPRDTGRSPIVGAATPQLAAAPPPPPAPTVPSPALPPAKAQGTSAAGGMSPAGSAAVASSPADAGPRAATARRAAAALGPVTPPDATPTAAPRRSNRPAVPPPEATRATPGGLSTTPAARTDQAMAQRGASPDVPSLDQIESRAVHLAGLGDVRGVERIKLELQHRRTAAPTASPEAHDLDASLIRLERIVLTAQRNRLAADAALFSGSEARPPTASAISTTASTPAAPPVATPSSAEAAPASDPFIADFRLLRPDLEQVARAAGGWTGGKPPLEFDVLSSLLPKLHALRPPPTMTAAFSQMCAALDQLIVLWASAAISPVPTGELPVVRRAVTAIDDLLLLDRTTGTAAQQ